MWKMDVPADNEYNNDLLVLARETNAWFINLVENKMKALQISVKVSFGLKVEF